MFKNNTLFRCRLPYTRQRQTKKETAQLYTLFPKHMKEMATFLINDLESKANIIILGTKKRIETVTKYFVRNVSNVIKQNTYELSGVARFCFELFDNNPAKSTNAIVKNWFHIEKLDLDALCGHIKEASMKS